MTRNIAQTHRIFLVLLLLLAGKAVPAHSHARYATHHTGFGSLMADTTGHATLVGDFLIDENMSDKPVIVVDSCLVPSSSFSYAIRFSNLHSKPGKSYTVTGSDGTRKVAVTQCGIVWDYVDSDNYWAAVVGNYNTSYRDDLTDRRMTSVSVLHCVGGTVTTVATKQVPVVADNIRNGKSGDGDLLTLRADVSNEQIKISVGKKQAEEVLTVAPERRIYRSRVGYYVGSGAKLKLERAVSAWAADDGAWRIVTEWDEAALKEYFSHSFDPVEGFWEYLDRDTDDRSLRLGGHYRIALVRNDEGGYDIVYIDGAQVSRSQWQQGLMKGRLDKTIFNGAYKALWIDAVFQPITDEVQATIDEGVILTIRFPVFNNSQIRFSKENVK